MRVTAVPARHWSGRGISDAHCSDFNGYVLSSDTLDGEIYFAGDTALMEDRISQPILDQFNIINSIQPGGPDEGRKDMESTHQSSADAILMHFKVLATCYQKLKQKKEDRSEPTLTFKLGNWRIKKAKTTTDCLEVTAVKNNMPFKYYPINLLIYRKN